jgi:hypothetical protein
MPFGAVTIDHHERQRAPVTGARDLLRDTVAAGLARFVGIWMASLGSAKAPT